jgi:hypothetical protein
MAYKTDNQSQSALQMGHAVVGTALAALATCVLLAGCGGSDPQAHTQTEQAKVVRSRPGIVIPGPARAACEEAVKSAPLLPSSAKPEIAALCYRINEVLEDNEKTVRSVCQEVANASQLSSESARTRTVSACYTAGLKTK